MPPPILLASRTPLLHRLRGRVTGLARFGVGLSARGLEAAGKFGLYALAVAWLGESPAGLFFLALTVLHVAATVTRLGTERILARNTAAYVASGQRLEARNTILHGLALNAATAALGGAVFGFAAEPIARLVGAVEAAPLLRLLAIVLPGQALAFSAGYILIGLGRPALAQLLMNAAPPVVTLAALALGVRSAEGSFLVYGLAYVASAAVALCAIALQFRSLAMGPPDRRDRLPGVTTGLRGFYWVELIQAAIIGAPMFALAHAASAAEVGAFSLANRLSMLVVTIVVSLGAMSSAALATQLRLGDDVALRAALRQLGRASALVGLPVVGAMVLLGSWLLHVLGVTAPAAAPVLALLALSQLPLVLFPGRDVLLASAGHDLPLRNINLAQAVVMFGGCAILVPQFGLPGAGVAAALTWAFGPIASQVVARRRLPQAFLAPEGLA